MARFIKPPNSPLRTHQYLRSLYRYYICGGLFCFAFFLKFGKKQICSLGLKLTLHQMISSKLWASVLIRKDSDGEALVDDLCCYRRGVWRFFWKEVLAFPGSFKQTNNVFHGKLSGYHMDEEPTTS